VTPRCCLVKSLTATALPVQNRAAVAEGKKPASARQEVMGMTRASIGCSVMAIGSFLPGDHSSSNPGSSGSSRGPTGWTKGERHHRKADPSRYRTWRSTATSRSMAPKRPKAERYPNRIWSDACYGSRPGFSGRRASPLRNHSHSDEILIHN
jgi:DNA-directed RNA polymerase subunit beta'